MNLMKTMKRLPRAAVIAISVVFLTASAKASSGLFPWPKLSFSGTMTFGSMSATNVNGNFSSGAGIYTVSFNNQSLMARLNASPAFIAALTNQFTNIFQIPAGSFFVWDWFNDKDIVITNRNGFSFSLDHNSAGESFGRLDWDDNYLFGDFTLRDATHAGTETDQTDLYFQFNDLNGFQFTSYGEATLAWTYGASVTANQKVTLNVTMSSGTGGYDGQVAGWNAQVNFKASGSGTGVDPVSESPFYQWWN